MSLAVGVIGSPGCGKTSLIAQICGTGDDVAGGDVEGRQVRLSGRLVRFQEAEAGSDEVAVRESMRSVCGNSRTPRSQREPHALQIGLSGAFTGRLSCAIVVPIDCSNLYPGVILAYDIGAESSYAAATRAYGYLSPAGGEDSDTGGTSWHSAGASGAAGPGQGWAADTAAEHRPNRIPCGDRVQPEAHRDACVYCSVLWPGPRGSSSSLA